MIRMQCVASLLGRTLSLRVVRLSGQTHRLPLHVSVYTDTARRVPTISCFVYSADVLVVVSDERLVISGKLGKVFAFIVYMCFSCIFAE